MDKLLVILSLLQKIGGRHLFQRMIKQVIILAGLTLTTAILISATLIGIVMAACRELMNYGVDFYTIILLFAALALLTIMILIRMIISRLHLLHRMPHTSEQSPFMAKVTAVIDAFTEGLMEDPKHDPMP